MSLLIHPDPVPLRPDDNGDIRVGESRVLLDLVVRAFQDRVSPEEIVQRYSTLSLPDVYAAIAYYLRHQEDVAAYLHQREERAAEIRRQIEARQGDQRGLRERLLARRDQREKSHAPAGQ